MQVEPLVTVLTPVYNGEDFLVECIDSVLKQTYKNFEYIIVNNCSKDRTLEIALRYAAQDSRIRVHDNENFVDVISNHNIAFRLMSPAAKYCKIVSGDDFVFPECLAQLVELAEANPSVGLVGCYQLSGDRVRWQGFRYPQAVLKGSELCRQMFLGDDPTFGLGSPTSLLYRADLVRNFHDFYPNPSPHSDTSACFQCLQTCDFGFVFQVLSFERIHEQTQSTASGEINRYASASLNDLLQYGPSFLSKQELDRRVNDKLREYHRFLAVNYFMAKRGKEFWDYHKRRLNELGFPLSRWALTKAAVVTLLKELSNLELATRKIRKRLFSRTPIPKATTS